MFGGFKNLLGGGGASSGDIVSYVGLAGGAEFRNELRKIDSSVQRTGANATRMGAFFKKAAKVATVAIAGILIGTSAMAANFESKMANVYTLLDVTNKEFKQLSGGVLDVSTRVGKSADSLSVALYDLVSAGVSAADSLQTLELAGKAATAGVTDTQTAVRAGMVVINSYALDIKQLNHVYDLQFKTVKKGVLTFEQYAGAIGTVVPMATALGVSLEGLHASIAVLTKSGQSAEMATTNLSRLFQGFVEQQDKFKQLGIQIFDVNGKFRGIMPVIGDLAVRMNGLTDEAKQAKLQLLGLDIRAARAVIPLINLYKTSGGLTDTFAEMTNSAWAMQEAFAKAENTTKHQFAVLKANIGAAAIEIGQELLPYLNEVITDFKRWVTEIRESGKLKEIFSKVGEGIKTVWEYTKKLGQFVSENGDVLLKAFGALIATKIVAGAAALATNIGAITIAVKGLATALKGGAVAKLLGLGPAGAIAAAGGIAYLAGEATYGKQVDEALARSHKAAEAIKTDIETIKKAGASGIQLLKKWESARKLAFDSADLENRVRPLADAFQKIGMAEITFGQNFITAKTPDGKRMPLLEYIQLLGKRFQELQGPTKVDVDTTTAVTNLNNISNAANEAGIKIKEALKPSIKDYGLKKYFNDLKNTSNKYLPNRQGFRGNDTVANIPVVENNTELKKTFKDLIYEFRLFADAAREMYAQLESGANRLANGLVDKFFGARVSLKNIFKAIAKDFLQYFIKEILKAVAIAVAKIVIQLIMFDVHENDMKAVKSGLDYAKFFSGGVRRGMEAENIAGTIIPQYQAPRNGSYTPLAVGGTSERVVKVEVETVPIPYSKARAWLRESNKNVLIPHTEFVNNTLRTKSGQYD